MGIDNPRLLDSKILALAFDWTSKGDCRKATSSVVNQDFLVIICQLTWAIRVCKRVDRIAHHCYGHDRIRWDKLVPCGRWKNYQIRLQVESFVVPCSQCYIILYKQIQDIRVPDCGLTSIWARDGLVRLWFVKVVQACFDLDLNIGSWAKFILGLIS
jgi:hypothetical protein